MRWNVTSQVRLQKDSGFCLAHSLSLCHLLFLMESGSQHLRCTHMEGEPAPETEVLSLAAQEELNEPCQHSLTRPQKQIFPQLSLETTVVPADILIGTL